MRLHGYLIMVASCIFFSASAAAARALSGTNYFVVAFWRFSVGAILVLAPWALGIIRVRFVRKGLLAARGIIGVIAISMYIAAVIKVGLAKATFLTYTYPAWAALFAILLLKERPHLLVWLSLAGSMLGSYLMLMDSRLGGIHFYEMLALIGAVLSGVAICTIKKLRDTDSSQSIFLSLSFFGVLLLAAPANWRAEFLPASSLALVIAAGVAATLGQLLMTYAYKLVPASEGSLVGLLTPLFNVVVASLIFHETLTPRSAVGAGLIFAACVLVMLRPGSASFFGARP